MEEKKNKEKQWNKRDLITIFKMILYVIIGIIVITYILATLINNFNCNIHPSKCYWDSNMMPTPK